MRQLWRMMTLAGSVLMLVATVAPATAAEDGPVNKYSSDVYTFADMPDLVDIGDAFLRRSDDGVSGRVVVDDAEPGIYTAWWVIWNTPEGCLEPFQCAEPDLFNPDAGLAIGHAGGGVVGDSGNPLRITGHLDEGATLGGFPYPEFSAIGWALTETTMVDSRHAEVFLVIRSHGPAIEGLQSSAKRTFSGACVYDPPIEGSAPAYGLPGPNTCTDLAVAIFASETAL